LLLAPVTLALAALLAVPARPAAAADEIELIFLYGSEKQKWLEEVTKAYEQTNPTVEGKKVVIKLKAMGSGETIEALLDEDKDNRVQAHLISPASRAYLDLGNARAVKQGEPALVGDVRHKLVRSPVVIAMWEPMARALGWGDPSKPPIGWQTIYELAKTPNAWTARGYPQWKEFRFGHTHPESSNSGLIAVLAQVFAANHKNAGLTLDDVRKPDTADFLKTIQRSVIHYGASTGFFADTMFTGDGPSFLSAAVLYENLVVESYTVAKYKDKLKANVVAIYPKEGTFWSDHPVAVVEREWVTPLHRKAAAEYIKFLMHEEQQRKALKFGFRPGLRSVPVGPPLTTANGVDPSKPSDDDELKPPRVEVMNECLKVWKANKRKARVVVVIDSSNDMLLGGKHLRAREGAERVIKGLETGDWVAILAIHDDKLDLLEPGTLIKSEADKKSLAEKAKVPADGKRLLYDAIARAHALLKETEDP
jgi:Ca-activated chloride channel family protein